MKRIGYNLMPFTLFISSLMMVMPLCSLAEQEHDHQTKTEHKHNRQYEAHVHGAGILNWVMEGQSLQISLKSPVINMLGFEHAPDDDTEGQQLTLMIENLNTTIKVFELTGGDCQLVSLSIINPFEKTPQYEKIERVNADEEMHTEVTAEYQLLCQQPSQLKTIDINLFDTFSGFELINSQWIVDGKQGGSRLNYNNHTLKVH